MNIFKQEIEYIKDNPKGYWFKRKLYGWGWTPVTREGWGVIILYLVFLFLLTLTVDQKSSTQEIFFMSVLPIILLTALLIRVCYLKGEKPKWMWGVEKKEESIKE